MASVTSETDNTGETSPVARAAKGEPAREAGRCASARPSARPAHERLTSVKRFCTKGARQRLA